jgi:hypothetical protein
MRHVFSSVQRKYPVLCAEDAPAQKLVDEFKTKAKGYFRGLGYALQTSKGGAFLDLETKERTKPTVYISWLSAAEKGSGAGTEALRYLTELADKYQVVLQLHVGVGPRRQGSTPLGRLKKFYGRHGFVLRGSAEMVRLPK